MIVSKINCKLISYVGYTNNLEKRVKLHNLSKGAKFTKGKKWQLVYYRKFNNKTSAMKYEYLLKNDKKKRNKIKSNYL